MLRRALDSSLRELRQAARRLARSPGFTTASILTLGLGLGAATAVYSLVQATLIRPLPYPAAERIVWLDHAAPGLGAERGLGMTDGLFVHYGERLGTLEDIAVWRELEVTLAGEEPERLRAAAVTPSFFRAIGVGPALGRAFTESAVRSGRAGILVSHGLWERRFGGARDIVGRQIRLDGAPVEVAGVMPAGFDFPAGGVEAWLPFGVDRAQTDFGGFSRLGIARLAPGATREAAEAEARAALPTLGERFGVERMLTDTRLEPRFPRLKRAIVREAELTLWVLLGGVAFVLLLACANVANLLLVRSESRRRDALLRRALGAGAGDLVRYFMAESLLISLAGGALGIGLAHAAVRMLVAVGPDLPRLAEVSVGGPTLAACGGMLLLTTLAFGLLPALRGSASLRAPTLGGRDGADRGGPANVRVRDALVATQVALALVLLIATGLMGRSFVALVNLDPGFAPEGRLTFEVGLATPRYPSRDAAVGFHREALRRLAALPGVEASGATTCLPLCGSWAGTQLVVDGRPDDPSSVPGVVAIRRVSEGYFGAVGTRLVAGRLPTSFDLAAGGGAAVISRELAADYWPGEDPLGARFRSGAGGDARYTVVGIVEDVPIRELSDDPPPMAYLPLLHEAGRDAPPHELSYVLLTSVRPQSLIGPAREILRALDPGVPMSAVATLDEIVSDASGETTFTASVLGLAAFLALALGLVGIYGVIAFVVGRRRKEIGIRLALGARPARVALAVVAQGSRITLVGLAIGVAAALGLTRLMRSLLFGVSPTDPVTFIAVPALLFLVALVACWLPARRAARVDPAETLRAD